jgi:DNA-binding transcriptional regulator YhcF (GntR family)
VSDRAHYLRIADVIAASIHSGELSPGERAPSARQIVREHGVAMATATRVLAELKSRQLVDTVPGKGTLVRTAARRDVEQALTQDDVLTTAIRIADDDGLEFLTMRRLAAALGLPTMSLYRFAANKSELTESMTDRVFADIELPDLAVARWRPRLEAAAHIFRERFALHPWAASVFSLTRPQLLPNVVRLVEWNLQTLRAMGLTVDEMMAAHINLFNVVVSMSRTSALERQAMADTGQSIDQWAEHHLRALPGSVAAQAAPVLTELTRRGYDYDLGALYHFGIRTMLDGLEARFIPRRSRP